MTPSILADACNPASPGCRPEHGSAGAMVTFLALLLVFAAVLIAAGVTIALLVVRARRRRRVPPGAASPAARWAPDPTGRHHWRWWDGARWTDATFDGGNPGEPRAGPSSPA